VQTDLNKYLDAYIPIMGFEGMFFDFEGTCFLDFSPPCFFGLTKT
jgi:hypothetical protein